MDQADGSFSSFLQRKWYPAKAVIWNRQPYPGCDEGEWVLEISGSIEGCSFFSRHTEPLATGPQNVAGLPSLYASQTPDGSQLFTTAEIASIQSNAYEEGYEDAKEAHERASGDVSATLSALQQRIVQLEAAVRPVADFYHKEHFEDAVRLFEDSEAPTYRDLRRIADLLSESTAQEI